MQMINEAALALLPTRLVKVAVKPAWDPSDDISVTEWFVKPWDVLSVGKDTLAVYTSIWQPFIKSVENA